VRILVVTDRYHPEVAAPSVRIGDHAVRWTRAGHEVTVVTCAPNFPRGELFPGYRNKPYQEEWIDGVRVVRVGSYMTANEGFVRRTLDYVSFMLSAAFFAWRYPAFDVLLASSPPLFSALGGWLIACLRRRPWAFEIRDLWPASIKAVGAADGPVIAFFEKLELFLYRRADLLVPLTESFRRDLVERGVPGDKIEVVRNGVDFERFSRHAGAGEARSRFGVPDDVFLAGYVGTTGMAHGLQTVLDAAALCADREDVRFLIMGEGAERGALEEDANRRGLDNLIFSDFVPHSEMPDSLAALDASIVHLRPDPLFETVIPSKIFEAMAVGLPIIMAVPGESAEIVEEAQAGLCIPSGDPAALAEATLRLADDEALRRHLGKSGLAAARTLHSRDHHAQRLLELLETTSAGGRRPA
jgi:colanic acid biosynthesis glycosyl transferase WcaI